jgi:hypothetical protein
MIYDISEIAFEQIHNEYYRARYGDFEVIMNINTRYINATHLCGLAATKTGKRKEFRTWRQNDSAEELINEVAGSVRIPADHLINIPVNVPNNIKGTYVHPDLIPHVACWASAKFAAKISKIVNEQIVREYRETIRAKDTKIDELMYKVDEQSRQIQQLLAATNEARTAHEQAAEQMDQLADDIENLSVDNAVLIQQNNQIAQKLDIATDNRVPPSPIKQCDQVFTVFHKPNTQLYRTIARQKRTLQKGISIATAAGYTTCVYRSDSPNAVKLGIHFKSMLPANIGHAAGSNITLLADRTTEDLIRFITAAEAEKKNV